MEWKHDKWFWYIPLENDFMGKPNSEQLDSGDAIFVDVMHTSANSQTQWDGGPIGNREQVIILSK